MDIELRNLSTPPLSDIHLGSHSIGFWQTKDLTLEDYVNYCSAPILSRMALLFSKGSLLTDSNVKTLTGNMDQLTKSRIWNIYNAAIQDKDPNASALKPLVTEIEASEKKKIDVAKKYCDSLNNVDFETLKSKLSESYKEFSFVNPKGNRKQFIGFLSKKLAFNVCKKDEQETIDKLVQSKLPPIPETIPMLTDEQLSRGVDSLEKMRIYNLRGELKDLYWMFCKSKDKISDDEKANKQQFLDYIRQNINKLAPEQRNRLAHTITKWQAIEKLATPYKEKLDQLEDIGVLLGNQTFDKFLQEVGSYVTPEYFAMYPSFGDPVLLTVKFTDSFRDGWERPVQRWAKNRDEFQRILAIIHSSKQVRWKDLRTTNEEKEIIKKLYAEYLAIHDVDIQKWNEEIKKIPK